MTLGQPQAQRGEGMLSIEPHAAPLSISISAGSPLAAKGRGQRRAHGFGALIGARLEQQRMIVEHGQRMAARAVWAAENGP